MSRHKKELEQEHTFVYTVEPPNKEDFGANRFVPCRDVVPISEVYKTIHLSISMGLNKCPVVPIPEGTFLEVPLYPLHIFVLLQCIDIFMRFFRNRLHK